jgi:hypothetical protein
VTGAWRYVLQIFIVRKMGLDLASPQEAREVLTLRVGTR